jgi:hypothetical protein
MNKNWAMKLFGVTALFLSLAGTSYGTIYYWSEAPANEEYTNLNNWKTLVVPTATDDAYFTNWISQTVKVSTPVTSKFCRVYGGTYTFDAPGSNHTVNLLGVGNLVDNVTKTNTMIISGATTVTVGNGQSAINIKDATKSGTHILKLLSGAKIVGANGGLYIGGYANRTGDTNIFIIDGEGSRSDFTSITMSANSLNALFVTNGGGIGVYNSNFHLYLNGLAPNKALRHESLVVIGGGSPESVANVGYLTVNGLGGTLANYEIQPPGVAKTNTSEVVILANGQISAKAYVYNYPAGTITLAGGKLAMIEGGANGILLNYGTIRGAGEILLKKNGQLQNITLASLTNASGYTAFGEIAPGSADSAGTIVISNYPHNTVTFPTYLEVRTNCRLKFDLMGTSTSQYDRIICTNMNVFLGYYANPYTVQGGAVVDVALTNNFVPVNGDYFDVLVASNIMDNSLSPVTFNFPAQPANLIWTPSIVTNAGLKTETLRLSVSGGRPTGTLFLIN